MGQILKWQGNEGVKEGDILLVGAVEYRVEAVGDWPFAYSSTAYKHLVLKEVKDG